MKKIVITLILIISDLTAFPIVFAAEYMGNNIDGQMFSATAYSYGTSKFYNINVEFEGNQALLFFRNGHITVDLDNEEIDDPHNISAYDYRRSVFWDLDVDDLD